MIQTKDFINYKYISGLEFSDDKQNLGFLVHQATLDENRYTSHIWTYNQKNQKYKQLSDGGKEKLFKWLDNQTILYPVYKNNSGNINITSNDHWTLLNQLDINNKII